MTRKLLICIFANVQTCQTRCAELLVCFFLNDVRNLNLINLSEIASFDLIACNFSVYKLELCDVENSFLAVSAESRGYFFLFLLRFRVSKQGFPFSNASYRCICSMFYRRQFCRTIEPLLHCQSTPCYRMTRN